MLAKLVALSAARASTIASHLSDHHHRHHHHCRPSLFASSSLEDSFVEVTHERITEEDESHFAASEHALTAQHSDHHLLHIIILKNINFAGKNLHIYYQAVKISADLDSNNLVAPEYALPVAHTATIITSASS